MNMIHLYGEESGEGSFVQVTRGVRAALEYHGLFAGFTDNGRSDMDEEPSLAKTALHVGWSWNSRRFHDARWALVAPNSCGLPPVVVEFLRRRGLSGLLAPSPWARGVLSDVFRGMRVELAPHGVTPGLHGPGEDASGSAAVGYPDSFRVLHVTSSGFSRKGTRELVRAWSRLMRDGELPADSELVIVGPETVVDDHLVAKAGASGVRGVRPVGLHPRDWVARMRGFHVVCQPSRAEGFGLLPLEALACGIPVVATTDTGHGAYMDDTTPGVVVVPTGPHAPSDDYPGASAPALIFDGLLAALALAYRQWPRLALAARAAAPAVVERWAWEKVLERPLKELVTHEYG